MKDKDSPGSFGSLETGRTSVEAVAVSGAAPQSEESGRAWDSEGQCWVYPADVQEALAKAIEAAKLLYGEPEYTYYRQRVTWHPRDKTHFVPVAPNGHEPITREEWEKNAAQAAVNETERFMGRLKQTYYRYERKQVAPAWREKLVEAIPKYPE